MAPRVFATLICLSALVPSSRAQSGGMIPVYEMMNGGAGGADAAFQQVEFAQLKLQQDNQKAAQAEAERAKLVQSGTVSVLDLQAPSKAMDEYNKAMPLLKQNPKEAVAHLQKALAVYPKFVTAHDALGIAYLKSDDPKHARAEFESATQLDGKFAPSFVNLARLEMSQSEFAAAEQHLLKATSLRPDADALVALAYVQQSLHSYHHAIATADRVHQLGDKGYANVHYIAAAAAIALHDYAVAERELQQFVKEDPENVLAPNARHNLEVLARYKNGTPEIASGAGPEQLQGIMGGTQTFPDTERLRNELIALGNEGDEECADCAVSAASGGSVPAVTPDIPHAPGSTMTIRRVVDEVAVYFTATQHGEFVNNLSATNVELRDDSKLPAQLLEFAPQAKLPMRLGLLIDTSGSVEQRFGFEKKAAVRFLQGLLTNPADLAFVMGFSTSHNVTQDFTASQQALAEGIDKLANGGGTALFDAVSFASWKLGLLPDKERVARVLVVLSDGEDNSSKVSLKKAIQDAAATGVTIYVISTKEAAGQGDYGRPTTTADHILEALAERSGGEAMFPGQLSLLGKKFDKLHDLIRNRYLIAYRPADFQPDGHYRKIAITVTQDGRQLTVRARKGYYARAIDAANSIPK
ncbi:MAG TPA: VWA domain-containing protein [Terriglobales bacterium]|nr:VWA domain-containing protein [Terriglobales bacterium]